MASPMSLLLLSDYVPGILKALQKEYYRPFFNLEVASTREQNTNSRWDLNSRSSVIWPDALTTKLLDILWWVRVKCGSLTGTTSRGHIVKMMTFTNCIAQVTLKHIRDATLPNSWASLFHRGQPFRVTRSGAVGACRGNNPKIEKNWRNLWSTRFRCYGGEFSGHF